MLCARASRGDAAGILATAGHFWLVPVVAQGTVINVVRSREEARSDREPSHPTDLQLASGAFSTSVAGKLKELPLPPGQRVYLRAEAKHEGNWIVEDVLHQVLPARGYEITFKEPEVEDRDTVVMHYRLVDARVVYSAKKKRWGLFGAGQRREVFGDLLLRLQEATGAVIWADRIETYGLDEVGADSAELLGESELVPRTEIAADNKVMELGLTGSIIGGLFYIFFVP